MKSLRQAAILLLLSAVPALGAYFLLLPPPVMGEGEMTLRQVEALGKEIVWVDARSKDRFERGHIPKAVLMTPSHMDEDMGDLFGAFSEDKAIVVYCEPSCSASHKVADRIRELGLEPVYVLRGGFEEWEKSKR